MGTEAGPLEAAGKDVNGVVKSIDVKLSAVGIMLEKVKSHCKGCPTVSTEIQTHSSSKPFSLASLTVPPNSSQTNNVYAWIVSPCNL